MAEEEATPKRARRRRSAAAAVGGLLDITPQLLPGVFSLLDTAEFAAVAQAHRRLSGPAQQWRERELLRLEKEIDAFMAAVRSGDRLVAVVEYAAPYLRYFEWDERGGGRGEEEKEGGGGGPVGNPVVVSNSASQFKRWLDGVKHVIDRQTSYVRHGVVTGPALPARIVLLRSKYNSVVEQDLLTKVLPVYPIFFSTGYYSGDFVLDDHKIGQLVSTKAFNAGLHHLAYTEVPGFLAEFSSNLWHGKHRWGRQLASMERFFTPVTIGGAEQRSVERYFPADQSLVLPSPLGVEALTRWSVAHPVYGY